MIACYEDTLFSEHTQYYPGMLHASVLSGVTVRGSVQEDHAPRTTSAISYTACYHIYTKYIVYHTCITGCAPAASLIG